MDDFADFIESYWQRTEVEVLPLPEVVEHYFKAMPFNLNKNDLLTRKWDATKHSIVKQLLGKKRLCKMLPRLGAFGEPLYEDMDQETNSNIYIRWNELYIRL